MNEDVIKDITDACLKLRGMYPTKMHFPTFKRTLDVILNSAAKLQLDKNSTIVAYEVDAIADKARLAHLELVLEEREQTISKLLGRDSVDVSVQTGPDARIVELEFALLQVARPSVCSVAVCTGADPEIESLVNQLAEVEKDSKAAKKAGDESFKRLEASWKDALSKLKDAKKEHKLATAEVANLKDKYEKPFKELKDTNAKLRSGFVTINAQCEDVMKDNVKLRQFIESLSTVADFLYEMAAFFNATSVGSDEIVSAVLHGYAFQAEKLGQFLRASRPVR